MDIRMVHNVCQVLQPNMADYVDDTQFIHWTNYAIELDEILFKAEEDGLGEMVVYINKTIADTMSTSARNHACVDVASTLQNLYPTFRNQFKF